VDGEEARAAGAVVELVLGAAAVVGNAAPMTNPAKVPQFMRSR